MVKRISDAEWRGDLQNGGGTVSLGSGAFNGPYSCKSRFEDGSGTNPEELLAAAHAACFSMAVSLALSLGQAGVMGAVARRRPAVQCDRLRERHLRPRSPVRE
jgi:OsmC subfamily peroxiredoxin